jgi:hypothetical protein
MMRSQRTTRTHHSAALDPQVYLPWVYVGLLGLSEVVSDLWHPLLGIWLHVILAAAIWWQGTKEEDLDRRHFYWILAVLAIVRIISFAISDQSFPGVWYYVLAETPLLVAALTARSAFGLSWSSVGVRMPKWPALAAVVIVTGAGLGYAESRIIHPAALISSLTWANIIIPSILLTIFTGLSEELLFRGLLQHYAVKIMGNRMGIVFVALGWSLLHIGWHSAWDVLFVFAVGLAWGWVREKTTSIIPTTIAHGLANVVLFLIVPFQ